MSEAAQQAETPSLVELVGDASQKGLRARRLEIGARIRRERLALGLGLRELAGLADINPGDLSGVETGAKWFQQAAERAAAVLAERAGVPHA